MGIPKWKQKQNAKTGSRSTKVFNKSEAKQNTEVFVPIRIYTDPLHHGTPDHAVCFKPIFPVWINDLAWSHQTHTLDMISSKKLPTSYLTTDHRTRCLYAERFHVGSTTALPTHPSQVSVRFRQYKPNWQRKVNAHSAFSHSLPNCIQCKRQQRLLPGTASTGLCQRSRQPCLHGGHQAARTLSRRACSLGDSGLWQWQWGDSPLIQLIRKVILCFQYETFHTVKYDPKTSWIQSSHTFKRDFIWYWI